MKRISSILMLLLLLAGGVAEAAVTTGYYRIKSNSYDNHYITENTSEHTLVTSARSEGNYAQVWYLDVSGTNVTIKNALTDSFIQANGTYSALYTTGTTSKTFTYAETDGKYTFTDASNYELHCSASQSYNVVQWYTNDNASVWTIESVTVNQTELDAQKAAFSEATTAQLEYYFTSTACTELNSYFAALSDADLRSAMTAMPTTVQDMAVKVRNNSWATYSGWDKTERTFRIADYKAYSSSSRWTNIMGYGYNLGRLSNPTGIYATAGEFLQVYVGAIPSGQTVKLEVAGYGQGSGTTYTLHEGMNSLQMSSSGNCFVFYEVDNTTNGAAPYTELSYYADVTVHIEGGTVQGYFDLTKSDDNDDWTQLKTHLMSKDMFCLKGTTLVFNLSTSYLKTAVDEASGGSTGKVVEMMNYWQGIQDMEDGLFNRAAIATSAYCNNVHTITTVGEYGAGSLYAYTYGIYFSPEQHNRLFNYDLFRLGSDNLWASAHELGHHRQKAINMVGCTEISNNIYSNVAVYQQGRYTSRCASPQTTFEDYMAGVSWPERICRANTSGTSDEYNQRLLRMNWQLYLFFHINGNDPDFFPQLFNALRSDPMVRTSGAEKLTLASEDYLKYYVKCCQVSGYDLTDFFAAYGFFMLPPEQATSITYNSVTTNRYQTFNDYGTYNLGVTQAMIDAAKAEVAGMTGLKDGSNVIFIDDRITTSPATYDGAPSGAVRTANDASSVVIGACGDMGMYSSYDATPTAYTFNVSERGNVTAVGSGAVGFTLYDGSGNLVGLYNSLHFALPAGLTDYTLKAMAGDGTETAATLDMNIEANDFPRTDYWYSLYTPNRERRHVTSAGTGEGLTGVTVSAGSTPATTQQWRFVLREGETETFDIQNRADGSYINPASASSSGSQLATSATQPSTGWTVTATGNYFIITTSDGAQLHQANWGNNYKVLNYGGGSNTSDDGCLYTVEPVALLDCPVQLNVVGNASYATFYFPLDVQTDVNTKAYYVGNVTSGSAQLTETNNGGRDIPARTAVVLVNGNKDTEVHFTITSRLTTVVSESDNLLKGTLTDRELDLAENTPYYSMGRKDGKIGFYKFDNNGTTTITLGANKAYLDTTVPGVKGFTLSFGDEDGIREVKNERVKSEKAADTVYDLSGRRMDHSQLPKGIYFVNGKKVVK